MWQLSYSYHFYHNKGILVSSLRNSSFCISIIIIKNQGMTGQLKCVSKSHKSSKHSASVRDQTVHILFPCNSSKDIKEFPKYCIAKKRPKSNPFISNYNHSFVVVFPFILFTCLHIFLFVNMFSMPIQIYKNHQFWYVVIANKQVLLLKLVADEWTRTDQVTLQALGSKLGIDIRWHGK